MYQVPLTRQEIHEFGLREGIIGHGDPAEAVSENANNGYLGKALGVILDAHDRKKKGKNPAMTGRVGLNPREERIMDPQTYLSACIEKADGIMNPVWSEDTEDFLGSYSESDVDTFAEVPKGEICIGGLMSGGIAGYDKTGRMIVSWEGSTESTRRWEAVYDDAGRVEGIRIFYGVTPRKFDGSIGYVKALEYDLTGQDRRAISSIRPGIHTDYDESFNQDHNNDWSPCDRKTVDGVPIWIVDQHYQPSSQMSGRVELSDFLNNIYDRFGVTRKVGILDATWGEETLGQKIALYSGDQQIDDVPIYAYMCLAELVSLGGTGGSSDLFKDMTNLSGSADAYFNRFFVNFSNLGIVSTDGPTTPVIVDNGPGYTSPRMRENPDGSVDLATENGGSEKLCVGSPPIQWDDVTYTLNDLAGLTVDLSERKQNNSEIFLDE